MATPWFSVINPDKLHIHLNPTMEKAIQKLIFDFINNNYLFDSGVWLASSGTSAIHPNNCKLYHLSSAALLSSAQAVNTHLKATPKQNSNSSDRWLNVLPHFHVGGLGILYRSYLLNQEPLDLWSPHYKWNPFEFSRACNINKITLSSLVPTQVFDLVKEQIAAPSNLRAIVVGGASLEPSLYQKALQLGWPLLPSFGMTEAASQIATASVESLHVSLNSPLKSTPPLTLLPHIKVQIQSDQRLLIQGLSLASGFYEVKDSLNISTWNTLTDNDGWYKTHDRVQLDGANIKILSRVDELVKVRGELINLQALRNQLDQLLLTYRFSAQATIVALPDERLGKKLILVSELSPEVTNTLLQQFNNQIKAYERLEAFRTVVSLPKNALGKIQYQRLLEQIQPGL